MATLDHHNADTNDTNDPFYDILRQRVAIKLKEHGIDPLKDRAATRQRIMYYLFVTFCWVCCGWYHITVRCCRVLFYFNRARFVLSNFRFHFSHQGSCVFCLQKTLCGCFFMDREVFWDRFCLHCRDGSWEPWVMTRAILP